MKLVYFLVNKTKQKTERILSLIPGICYLIFDKQGLPQTLFLSQASYCGVEKNPLLHPTKNKHS